MKLPLAAYGLVIVLSSWGGPAFSQPNKVDGWGALKFGQTHREALDALDGRGELHTNGTITVAAKVAGDDYQVTANFEGDRLAYIDLISEDPLENITQCHKQRERLADSLESKYGKSKYSTFDQPHFFTGFQNVIEATDQSKIVLTEFNKGSGISFSCRIVVRYKSSVRQTEDSL